MPLRDDGIVPGQERAEQAAGDARQENGQPARVSLVEREGEKPGENRDSELDPRTEQRHEQGEEREREDEVDAELRRVGNRGAEQEAAQRREVPGDEQAQLDAEQEGECTLAGSRGDPERLVGEEEGCDRPLPATEVELAAYGHA